MKITTQRFRTSALFECYDCGEQWQKLETARQEAYRHTQKTGHKVTGEIGTSYHYDPKLPVEK
mgnify:CR=1 FL=1